MDNQINKVGIFLIVFITLIVGIVLLQSTSDFVWQGTDANSYIANDTITLINGTAVSLTNNWVVNDLSVIADNVTGNHTLTETTQYILGNTLDDGVATVTLLDAGFDGNTSYVSYTYQDDNYIRDGTSRVLIKLIIIFFAIAILSVGVWAVYKMGLMDMIK